MGNEEKGKTRRGRKRTERKMVVGVRNQQIWKALEIFQRMRSVHCRGLPIRRF